MSWMSFNMQQHQTDILYVTLLIVICTEWYNGINCSDSVTIYIQYTSFLYRQHRREFSHPLWIEWFSTGISTENLFKIYELQLPPQKVYGKINSEVICPSAWIRFVRKTMSYIKKTCDFQHSKISDHKIALYEYFCIRTFRIFKPFS